MIKHSDESLAGNGS